MGGYGYDERARVGRAQSLTDSTGLRRLSDSSATHTNPLFFETSAHLEVNDAAPTHAQSQLWASQKTAPTHAQSQSWTSQKVKDQQQFERTKKLLSHFAPEQFRPQAKPTREPANIVPRTPAEMAQHHTGMKLMAIDVAKKDMATMMARKAMPKEAKAPLRPAFDGKRFLDNRSPVMSQFSIWATYRQVTPERPQIDWPSASERYEDGEKRENIHAPTRCGRFLPVIRHPETGEVITQYPIDQVGPIRSQGPTPAECKWENDDMDNDRDFERVGVLYLGGDMYSEVGEWQAPFVPDWLAEKRSEELRASEHFFY